MFKSKVSINEGINYQKVSLYYFFGTLFSKGITFVSLPIFSRILSTYDYGVVTTYNSWVLIAKMIMGLALHTSIQVGVVDYKKNYNEYTSSIIWFSILNSCIDGVIAFVLISHFSNVKNILVLMCLINAFSVSVIEDYSVYLMMKYQYKIRTCFMVLPNLLAIILSVYTINNIVLSNRYIGRIVPTAITQFIFAIIAVVIITIKSKPVLKKEYIMYGIRISIPLIAHGISLTVLAQSDRIMLTSFSGADQTGIYSLIYNFAALSTAITTAVDGAWVPWFYFKLGDKQYDIINEKSKFYIVSMAVIMSVVMLISPEIIILMADSSYWEGIIIIPPIVMSNYVIFMYSLYVNIEHYHKRTMYIMFNTVLAAIINICLNYIFVPQYGYVAAACTTIFSYIVAFVLHFSYAKKLEKHILDINMFYVPIISVIVSILVFYLFKDFLLARLLFILIILIIYIMLNQKKIGDLIKYRFNKGR
ncbi:lipopolysaccharide biosynthesis protein [Lachnospiraceae bacterium C1.1]|nr:oligosaccharide flippase family protein [Lachnospiraceae bacterium C1.1]